MALQTMITELLGIEHPVVLGGMGSGGTGHRLVAEVSSAGGLGILSASWLSRAEQQAEVEAIRHVTDRPFGLNHLLCFVDESASRRALTCARRSFPQRGPGAPRTCAR